MSAGTLTLTNKSAAVTGAGTAFSTELAAGDFIVVTVGGVPYTLPVKTVNSNTSLTLVSNFTGPTQSGASWSAVPRVALNMVTAALVTQSAEALRGLNYDKQNWQQVFSGTGTITVKLPDGSSFTGPSWKYLADNVATKVSGAVPVSQGGTGAQNKADALSSLGAFSSSGGTISGNVTLTGSLTSEGFSPNSFQGNTTITGASQNALSLVTSPNSPNLWLNFQRVGGATGWRMGRADGGGFVLVCDQTANTAMNLGVNDKIYSTANTTKASDGTLKAASPVARIINSREETERTDVCEEGFAWCGCGTANAEAEGVSISRLDVGVYVLTGSAGLASEGWQLLPPMDPGGMGELGVVEAEETASGVITIRLFKRRYMMGEDGDIVKTKGVPMDVPAQSWIDVRMDMPEDSIWKSKSAGEPTAVA